MKAATSRQGWGEGDESRHQPHATGAAQTPLDSDHGIARSAQQQWGLPMRVVVVTIVSWGVLFAGLVLGSAWRGEAVNLLDSALWAAVIIGGVQYYQHLTTRLETLERRVRYLERGTGIDWKRDSDGT